MKQPHTSQAHGVGAVLILVRVEDGKCEMRSSCLQENPSKQTKTSCLTPGISANMFPTHQKDPPQILNNKSAPCQSLTHQINVTGRTNSLASPCRSDSAELTAVCDFCRGTGITSLFCLLIKVKHPQVPKPQVQAQKYRQILSLSLLLFKIKEVSAKERTTTSASHRHPPDHTSVIHRGQTWMMTMSETGNKKRPSLCNITESSVARISARDSMTGLSRKWRTYSSSSKY